MAEWLAVVTCVSILAKLAMPPHCVMATLQTNTSADSSRLLVHGHTEPTLSRMTITFTCWDKKKIEVGRVDNEKE